MNYEELFLEGYYDALEELNDIFLEGSTTAKYLNHHSLGGTFFGPPLFRWFNSELKKGDSFMGVHKLYPKYLKYCAKRGYSALSKEEFIEEGKKYYTLKAKVDVNQLGGSVLGGALSGYGTTMADAAAMDTAITGGAISTSALSAGTAFGIAGGLMAAGSNIASEVYRRKPEFVDKAKMRHDLKGI